MTPSQAIKALRSSPSAKELSEIADMLEGQGMESAPKDGTEILVRFWEPDITHIVSWYPEPNGYNWLLRDESLWGSRYAKCWWPLPAIPTLPEGQSDE